MGWGEYDTVGSEKRQSLSTILLQIRCFADAINHTILETGEPGLLWHQQILFLKTTYSGFDA